MPYLPTTNQYYKFNYSDLENYFMKMQVFKRRTLQKNYIHRWMEYLEKIDRVIEEECASNSSPANIYVNLDDEIFPQNVTFDSINIKLHFNATNIDKFLKDREVLPISTSLFKYQEGIHFTKTDGKLYKLKGVPTVLLAEFYNNPFIKAYVVDGSHRLTSAISNGYSEVNAKIITEKELSHFKQGFATEWDYAFYLFINEMSIMHRYTTEHGEPEKVMLNNSYLSDGYYGYYKLDFYPYNT